VRGWCRRIEGPAAVEDVPVQGSRRERQWRRCGVRHRDSQQEPVNDEADQRIRGADDEKTCELAHSEIITDAPEEHFHPVKKMRKLRRNDLCRV